MRKVTRKTQNASRVPEQKRRAPGKRLERGHADLRAGRGLFRGLFRLAGPGTRGRTAGGRFGGRDKRVPGFALLRLILRGLAGNGRDANENVAGGTFDLAAGVALLAFEMLPAVWALEFEFAHWNGKPLPRSS